MKILVGIPVLFNGETCLKAFKSVIDEADLLIVDNGSTTDVKEAITEMARYNDVRQRVAIIKHETNQYVNKAWSEIIGAFLDKNCPYDQLIIMNSDLIMHHGWSNFLINGQSCIPSGGEIEGDVTVYEGTPGVFIHLNKEMAKLIYPIPESIKIWFGDQWIYEKLRKSGYKTIVKACMIATHWHNGSQTCQKLPEFQEIIEQDKLAWLEIEKTL